MAFKVLQLRRDTAADWTSNDPTLAAGELGVETDTLKFKIGDGTTAWTSLAYQGGAYTDEQAQDAVGGMIADTNSIDLTYTDGTPELKADLKISATPGDVTVSVSADGLKAAISAIDLGASA
jgi:hypothetical protein